MHAMRFLKGLLVWAAITMIAACGGGSTSEEGGGGGGSNPPPPTTRTEVTGALSLAAQAADGGPLGSLDEGVQARLVATLEKVTNTVRIADNVVVGTAREPIAGQIVRFATPGGTLLPSNGQVLTDAAGKGIATYTAGAQTGAWTLTATASPTGLGGLTATANVFIVRVLKGKITVEILDNFGLPITQVQGGQIYGVRAKLERIYSNSEGIKLQTGPIANAAIAFSTDGGSLEPANGKAVTGADGTAFVRFQPNIIAATFRMNATATVDDETVTGNSPYTVRVPGFRLGVIEGGQFRPGLLDIARPVLPAGGQTTVRVYVVGDDGAPFLRPVNVTFSSRCVVAGTAQITSPVAAANGIAVATYTARPGCVGTDLVSATARAEGLVFEARADGSITVDPPVAEAIEYLSATPRTISLGGRGTPTRPERSEVKFIVRTNNNLPVPNTQVSFSLSGTLGGARVVTSPLTTDNTGTVTATLQAGTVATIVRVVATIPNGRAATSEPIAISTGTPDAASFSLSTERLNVEAFNVDGVTSELYVRVSDRFANPVETQVYFTASGGQVTPSCISRDGVCSVQWRSANPRPANGRVVILARAEGDESFVDLDGNAVYDRNEAFVDLSEAFVDANESGAFDAGETFFDRSGNGQWNTGNGLYDGLLCAPGALCGTSGAVDVRDGLVIVMSTSDATIRFVPSAPVSINETTPADITIEVADRNGNLMAPGTRVEISTSNGTLTGTTSYTLGESNAPGPFRATVNLRGDGTPSTGALTVRVTSPRGVVTTGALGVTDTTVCNQPYAPLPAVCGQTLIGSIAVNPTTVRVSPNATVVQPIAVVVRDNSPQQRPWLGANVTVACVPATGTAGYTVNTTGTIAPTSQTGETVVNLSIASTTPVTGTTTCTLSTSGVSAVVTIAP